MGGPQERGSHLGRSGRAGQRSEGPAPALWRAEALQRPSDLVRRAQVGGPQLVTKSGRDAVVVLSVEDYSRLAGPHNLVEFLASSPLAEALREDGLDLDRPP